MASAFGKLVILDVFFDLPIQTFLPKVSSHLTWRLEVFWWAPLSYSCLPLCLFPGITETIAQLISGWVTDRNLFHKYHYHKAYLILCGLVNLLSPLATSYILLMVYAVFFAIFCGGYMALLLPVLVRKPLQSDKDCDLVTLNDLMSLVKSSLPLKLDLSARLSLLSAWGEEKICTKYIKFISKWQFDVSLNCCPTCQNTNIEHVIYAATCRQTCHRSPQGIWEALEWNLVCLQGKNRWNAPPRSRERSTHIAALAYIWEKRSLHRHSGFRKRHAETFLSGVVGIYDHPPPSFLSAAAVVQRAEPFY